MDQRLSSRDEAGQPDEIVDHSESHPRDPPDERLNGVESAHSRASLSLSRRKALTSLLGVSGFSLLSAPVSAVRGTFQSQNGTGGVLNPQFTHTGTLSNPDPSAGDEFGFSLALSADGTTAIVGAPRDDITADEYVGQSGEAYVFMRAAAGWSTDNSITIPNPEPDLEENFGTSVAVNADGTTALIGAPDDRFDGISSGAAYVFARTAKGWDTDNPVTIRSLEPESSDEFGAAVALNADGTTALIGTPGEALGWRGKESGAAYIIMCTGAGWDTNDPVRLPNPKPDREDAFGGSVALSADGMTALVSAYRTDTEAGIEVGEAYVFTQTATGWNTENPVTLPNPKPNYEDYFGRSVALSADGNTALVGAPRDGPVSPYTDIDRGVAYIFTRTETGWNTEDAVTLPNPEPDKYANSRPDRDDYFGNAVALSADGTTALVGAHGDETETVDGSWIGEAYLFRQTTEGWNTSTPVTLSNPKPDLAYEFGRSVALNANGTTALVGAPAGRHYGGEAYLFERGAQSLVFENQTSTGKTVTVSRVTMPEGGFVVIAAADGDTIYGVSDYLVPGTSTDLQITLDTPLPGDGTFLAVGQADTNGNERFDASRARDVCQLKADGSPLVDTARIILETC